MSKTEVPLNHLQSFLPEGSLDDVMQYLHTYKVHLTITRQRKSVLGDYRNKHFDKNHRITVNGNLNKYSFLITLLHEIAHLLAFEKYGLRIQPHGQHWKDEYGNILATFLQKDIFPAEIRKSLLKILHNPGASSCADIDLTRVLRKFDTTSGKASNKIFVEELPVDSLFKTEDGRIFKKGKKRRTRFECAEAKTGKLYLFSPIHEVIALEL
jgi:SprT protein